MLDSLNSEGLIWEPVRLVLELQRVRGTVDVLPQEASALQALAVQLGALFARHGYELVDTPVLENLDLFLRKSGDEIAARMYAFTHWNRKLCLRPEFTASVMRAYVNHLQEQPLPVRVQYVGPTFRYEKPQRGRYRQFTELGIECIGGPAPAADAEMLYLACAGLQACGVQRHRLVVGHLGAVLQLLSQLGIEQRGQTLILAYMEQLSRRQVDRRAVVDRVRALLGVNGGLSAEEADDLQLLPQLLSQFGAERATQVAYDLLQRASLNLEGGSRTTDEIVERLLSKANRPDPGAQVETAVDFIGRLHDLVGPPDKALGSLAALLREYQLDSQPLDEVRAALELFSAYGAAPPEIEVDLSLGRGLRYYTGLVFEIYFDGPDGALQICGGGRYDDLVRALGGRDAVPACGFSYGLERLRMAGASAASAAPERAVLVAPLERDDQLTAVAVAQLLREAGYGVELDVRLRGIKANLRHADRQNIPLVCLVGERERAEGKVRLRNMVGREELMVPLDQVAAAARELLGG